MPEPNLTPDRLKFVDLAFRKTFATARNMAQHPQGSRWITHIPSSVNKARWLMAKLCQIFYPG